MLMVTEEQPHAMLIPLEYFLMGYDLYWPSQLSVSPRSPLSPSCIAPELLSPESMGLKLVHKRGKRKDVRKNKLEKEVYIVIL